MIKTALVLIFIIGAILVYLLLDGYWLIAWIGLWFAFVVTCKKLPMGDVLRLWSIVLTIIVVMLGGGIILARLFGEWAGGIWIVVCMVLLMILRKRIIHLSPVLQLAQMFEDIVNAKTKK